MALQTPDNGTAEHQLDGVETAEREQSPDPSAVKLEELKGLQNSNDRTQALLDREDGKEKIDGIDRFREIVKRQMSYSMQAELGINIYTNVEKMETNALRDKYAIIQKSYQFVSSHTPESLGHVFQAEIQIAAEEFMQERPDEQQTIEGIMQNQDIEFVQAAMLEMLDTVNQKLTAEMEKPERGLNESPAQEHERRIEDGELVRPVNAVPPGLEISDRDIVRKFRNLALGAQTEDGIALHSIYNNTADTPQEKAATVKFNKLVQEWNTAIKDCVEGDKNEQQARISLINEYGISIIDKPITDSPVQSFKDWLKNKRNRVKQAEQEGKNTTK